MFVASYSNQMYAILRIVAGGLLACHGGQKLFGLFGGFGGNPGATAPVPSLLALAGFIEFFGGLLIALGLLTSYAAFIASGQMAVACFMVHASAGYVPIQNGGELAVLYCFLFLFIAARGRDAGKLSMNRKMRTQKYGIVLIIIGLSFPIIFFGFASGYVPQHGLLWSLSNMEVVLIPYPWFLALGVILVGVGIALILLNPQASESPPKATRRLREMSL